MIQRSASDLNGSTLLKVLQDQQDLHTRADNTERNLKNTATFVLDATLKN